MDDIKEKQSMSEDRQRRVFNRYTQDLKAPVAQGDLELFSTATVRKIATVRGVPFTGEEHKSIIWDRMVNTPQPCQRPTERLTEIRAPAAEPKPKPKPKETKPPKEVSSESEEESLHSNDEDEDENDDDAADDSVVDSQFSDDDPEGHKHMAIPEDEFLRIRKQFDEKFARMRQRDAEEEIRRCFRHQLKVVRRNANVDQTTLDDMNFFGFSKLKSRDREAYNQYVKLVRERAELPSDLVQRMVPVFMA